MFVHLVTKFYEVSSFKSTYFDSMFMLHFKTLNNSVFLTFSGTSKLVSVMLKSSMTKDKKILKIRKFNFGAMFHRCYISNFLLKNSGANVG